MKIGQTEAWRTWDAPAEGMSLREWQDGRCAWCGTNMERLVTDHCHDTGFVRGYLCSGCNTHEGVSNSLTWNAWRSGDTPARAIGHVEFYKNHMGYTPIGPQSALNYYSPTERVAWWAQTEMPDPLEAPWTEAAIAARKADWDAMRTAMENSPLGRAIGKLFGSQPEDAA